MKLLKFMKTLCLQDVNSIVPHFALVWGYLKQHSELFHGSIYVHGSLLVVLRWFADQTWVSANKVPYSYIFVLK